MLLGDVSDLITSGPLWG